MIKWRASAPGSFAPMKIPSWEGQKAQPSGVGPADWGQPTPAPLPWRGLIFIVRRDPEGHEKLPCSEYFR
ncbi:MAG: hypothetical protein DMG06_14240 [Acidobacteria bacterium]|nr:MAG: hypothetical protein DMG06_14240 [Acidobacteriota bacterium]